MILLSINALANCLVLYTLLLYPYVYLFKPKTLLPFVIACFLVQVFLLILGMTRKGHWILSLYQSYRTPVQRELDYIKPLASEVINQHNRIYNTNYDYTKFNFYVSDVQEPNAYAFSKHCIVISAGFLAFASEDEFKAVLAHELGHLYYKDTQILMGALWVEIPTRIFKRLHSAWAKVNTALMGEKQSLLTILALVSMLVWLIFIPAYLVSAISSWLFNLVLKLTAKRTEYRADHHAYKVCYGAGLVSFLEKLSHTIAHDSRFFSDLVASHPAPMLRIGRLEDYFKNGSSKVNYDKITPIDKLLPTLLLVGIMGSL